MNARISNPALAGLSGAVLALAAGELFLFDGVRALRSETSTVRASLVSEVSGFRMSTSLDDDARGEQLDWLRTQVRDAIAEVQSAAAATSSEVQRYAQRLTSRLALKQRRDQAAASAELDGARAAAERAHAAIGELAAALHQTRASIAGTSSGIGSADSEALNVRTDLAMLHAGAAQNARGLDRLRTLNERVYYDVDLRKGEHITAGDGITIVLRKTNPRRSVYTVAVVTGNGTVVRENQDINEPVTVYASTRTQPYVLVVRSIEKNHIKGYLSAPRPTWVAAD